MQACCACCGHLALGQLALVILAVRGEELGRHLHWSRPCVGNISLRQLEVLWQGKGG